MQGIGEFRPDAAGPEAQILPALALNQDSRCNLALTEFTVHSQVALIAGCVELLSRRRRGSA